MKNDEVIIALKKEIDTKKAQLEQNEKFVPKTNCSLELNGTRYNIHTLQKDVLLHLLLSLKANQMAMNDLKIEDSYEISGYPVQDWIDDLLAKYNISNLKKEKDRLKKLEDKLYNLLSTDKKVELELEDLKSQI